MDEWTKSYSLSFKVQGVQSWLSYHPLLFSPCPLPPIHCYMYNPHGGTQEIKDRKTQRCTYPKAKKSKMTSPIKRSNHGKNYRTTKPGDNKPDKCSVTEDKSVFLWETLNRLLEKETKAFSIQFGISMGNDSASHHNAWTVPLISDFCVLHKEGYIFAIYPVGICQVILYPVFAQLHPLSSVWSHLSSRVSVLCLFLRSFVLLPRRQLWGLTREPSALVDGVKTHGCGICVYIHNAWCRDTTMVYKHCFPLAEFIIIKCLLFHLPGEITAIC